MRIGLFGQTLRIRTRQFSCAGPVIGAALAVLTFTSVDAMPAKIIILRHGEKASPWKLCAAGQARAQALAGRYLGKGAEASIFAPDEVPAAFVAITPHTMELAAPAAESWGLPVTMFPALPGDDGKDAELDTRTQQAAAFVLGDKQFDGRTVVMVWEHHHIADAALEAAAGEKKITLRQLLGLDTMPAVPATWPGANYDYFWIATYGADGTPRSFTAQQQLFPGNGDVPQNGWEEKQPLPAGCIG